MMKFFLSTILVLCAVSALAQAPKNPAVYGDIPDYGEKYLSPDFVKIQGKSIFVTCRTGDELRILSAGSPVPKIIPLGGHPSGVAISPDGKYAYVTIAAPAGKLLKIDLPSSKIIATIDAKHMPRAVIASADGKVLYVANQFENAVRAYDSANLKEIAKGSAIRETFSMALSKDGKKLYVLNQLPESKGGLYEENIACAVTVMDSQNLKTLARIDLPNGSINAQEIALSPDGKFAYLTHNVARFNVPTTQVEKGWISTNAVSVVDTATDKLHATFLIDDIELGAANPYGIAVSPDGKNLVVAHSGTHEISVIDRPALDARIDAAFAASTDRAKVFDQICNDLSFLSGIRTRVALEGFGPRHLDIFGNMVFVGMYYSDVLNRVDLQTLKPVKVQLAGNENLNEMRSGDLFYHDASLCFQKWLACVTCHTEVRSDDLNWDLLNDGIGNPKQSKSMLFSHFTPPTMITGVRASGELCVRKGLQHIQFTKRPEKDCVAIDKYLMALLPVESPYLVNGKMSESAKRGEMIFEMANCSKCHSGKFYTDMQKHDVGSGLDEYENFAFDTPTLIEVWRTAPYLYDGRARTIFEMLKKFNKNDKHGKTSDLSDEELRDLEAYVLTL